MVDIPYGDSGTWETKKNTLVTKNIKKAVLATSNRKWKLRQNRKADCVGGESIFLPKTFASWLALVASGKTACCCAKSSRWKTTKKRKGFSVKEREREETLSFVESSCEGLERGSVRTTMDEIGWQQEDLFGWVLGLQNTISRRQGNSWQGVKSFTFFEKLSEDSEWWVLVQVGFYQT